MSQNNHSNLDEQLKRHGEITKKAKIANFFINRTKLAFSICIILPVIVIFINDLLGILLLFLMYFGAVPFGIYVIFRHHQHQKASKDVRAKVVAEIIPSILNEFFQNVEYRPDGIIPEQELRDTSIWRWDSVFGSDYIKGTYKGLPFQLCDAQAGWTERVPRGDNNHYEDVYHYAFRGQWVILQTVLRPNAVISVAENTDRTSVFKNAVETENMAFNERFEVAGEQTSVFEVITPPMMERLLAADAADNGSNSTYAS